MAGPDRSHLPPAVRDKAKKADELIAAAAASQTPPVDPGSAPANMPADGAETATQPNGEPRQPQPDAGPSAPTPPSAAPAVAPSPPSSTADGGEWEQRYKTLQGKYDSELADERRQRQALERRLQALETPPSPPPAPSPPPPPARAKVELTADEIEAAGPQLVDIIKKAARAEVHGDLEELDRLRAQIADVSTSIEDNADQTARMAFGDFLGRLDRNPDKIDWRNLQLEPEFRTFMDQKDAYSGVRRQDLLVQAVADLDTERALAFYKGYLAERRIGSAQTPQAAPPVNGPPAVRLETQLAPSSGAGSSPAAGPAAKGRVWSSKQISAFYEARRRGDYRGREKEAQDLERDLFEAGMEGRIVG